MDINGNVQCRDIDCNGNIQIDARTHSSNTTTGALVVSGGVGIQGNVNIGGFSNHAFDASFNGNIQLTQTNNPLWLVSRNASTINGTLASGSDVGIFYGTTNPAAGGLVISPRGIGSGIKMSTNGNVGIGVSTPTVTLDVAGAIKATGAITGATATNTINNVIINAGAVSGVTTLSLTGLITQSLGTYTPPLANSVIGYSVTTTGTNTNTISTAFNALNNTFSTGVSIPVAGVWLINYIGALANTATTLSAGNVSFGLSFTPSNSGNTVLISTARIPIVSTAIYGAAGLSSFSLQGSHVYTGASTTVYLNCNLSATNGLATRPCSLTLTRIA